MAATPLAEAPPRAARVAGACARGSGESFVCSMSTQPQPVTEARASDGVAGFLASVALFASFIGLAYRPVRIIPFALVLALIASGMGGRHQRLATAALGVGAVCFVVGMAVAVITNNPVF